MPVINLHGPALDKLGQYVDAGNDLIVGDDEHADISTEAAIELVDGLRAVEVTEEA